MDEHEVVHSANPSTLVTKTTNIMKSPLVKMPKVIIIICTFWNSIYVYDRTLFCILLLSHHKRLFMGCRFLVQLRLTERRPMTQSQARKKTGRLMEE